MPKLKAFPLPSQEHLHKMLEYSCSTGVFRWKASPGRRTKRGQIAGYAQGGKYWTIRVNNVKYKAHRLAWMYVYGVDPGEMDVDHTDRNGLNNSIFNLRLVRGADNVKNARGISSNATGIKGVHLHHTNGFTYYRAQINSGGLRLRRSFKSKSDAENWVRQARKTLHRDFACDDSGKAREGL